MKRGMRCRAREPEDLFARLFVVEYRPFPVRFLWLNWFCGLYPEAKSTLRGGNFTIIVPSWRTPLSRSVQSPSPQLWAIIKGGWPRYPLRFPGRRRRHAHFLAVWNRLMFLNGQFHWNPHTLQYIFVHPYNVSSPPRFISYLCKLANPKRGNRYATQTFLSTADIYPLQQKSFKWDYRFVFLEFRLLEKFLISLLTHPDRFWAISVLCEFSKYSNFDFPIDSLNLTEGIGKPSAYLYLPIK